MLYNGKKRVVYQLKYCQTMKYYTFQSWPQEITMKNLRMFNGILFCFRKKKKLSHLEEANSSRLLFILVYFTRTSAISITLLRLCY